MELYKISTCKFTDQESHTYVMRLIYEESQEQLCVMDPDTRIATDIFTREQFYVLKKDNNNRIIAEEKVKIGMNEKYGIYVKKMDEYLDFKTIIAYYATIQDLKKAKKALTSTKQKTKIK